jgi:hypothetical protein
MVMGSPGFTAPERIKGGDATPASDLWSLGATLYAAVQGYGPYEARGGAITTMSAIINEDAPAAAAAGALDTVISALLRREPADRPDAATAAAIIADMTSQLPDRAGQPLGGYQPTMLSAGPAVLSAGPAVLPPAGPAGPAGQAAPPTMPQPGIQAGADTWGQGAPREARPEPDFSSWYSQARPAGPANMPPAPASAPARPPASRPADKRPADKRRAGLRWILVLVALAIIGAGAGAATVMLLRHNDAGGSGTTGSSIGSGASSSTGAAVPALVAAINNPSSGPYPNGFTAYTQAAGVTGTTAGFSLQYPDTWTPSRPPGDTFQTRFTNPAGDAYALLDLTAHKYPGDMLKEGTYIRNAEANDNDHPNYVGIALARHDIQGAPGAYWQFTYTNANGVRLEALDLLWVASTAAGQQSYAMYFSAPAAQWSKFRPIFVDMARSFQTVPH